MKAAGGSDRPLFCFLSKAESRMKPRSVLKTITELVFSPKIPLVAMLLVNAIMVYYIFKMGWVTGGREGVVEMLPFIIVMVCASAYIWIRNWPKVR
jgi:hypothetical protein